MRWYLGTCDQDSTKIPIRWYQVENWHHVSIMIPTRGITRIYKIRSVSSTKYRLQRERVCVWRRVIWWHATQHPIPPAIYLSLPRWRYSQQRSEPKQGQRRKRDPAVRSIWQWDSMTYATQPTSTLPNLQDILSSHTSRRPFVLAVWWWMQDVDMTVWNV